MSNFVASHLGNANAMKHGVSSPLALAAEAEEAAADALMALPHTVEIERRAGCRDRAAAPDRLRALEPARQPRRRRDGLLGVHVRRWTKIRTSLHACTNSIPAPRAAGDYVAAKRQIDVSRGSLSLGVGHCFEVFQRRGTVVAAAGA